MHLTSEPPPQRPPKIQDAALVPCDVAAQSKSHQIEIHTLACVNRSTVFNSTLDCIVFFGSLDLIIYEGSFSVACSLGFNPSWVLILCCTLFSQILYRERLSRGTAFTLSTFPFFFLRPGLPVFQFLSHPELFIDISKGVQLPRAQSSSGNEDRGCRASAVDGLTS